AKHFVNLGARIRERNWRPGRYAEIDLIVDIDGVTVFVEVKTRRRSPQHGGHALSGVESIKWRKQRKIVTAARLYFARQRLPEPVWRVDVLVVEYVMDSELKEERELPDPQIIHVVDAICM